MSQDQSTSNQHSTPVLTHAVSFQLAPCSIGKSEADCCLLRAGDLSGEPAAANPEASTMGGMFDGLSVDTEQSGAQPHQQQQADGLQQRQGGFAGGSAMPGHPQGAQHSRQSPLDLLGGLSQPAPQHQAAHAAAGESCSLCWALFCPSWHPEWPTGGLLSQCWVACSKWCCHFQSEAG